MKKRIYLGKNGFEVINSKKVMPNYICDCPKDDEGNIVDDLSCLEIVDKFEDVRGNQVFVGREAIINSDQYALVKTKRNEAKTKVKQIKDQRQQLVETDWDTAKIADVRKAIKFLLGVE